MAKEIKIPQIAEGVDKATVTEVLVSEGDSIEKDDSLITVESDKASVEIPSPEAGKVASVEVSEGDEVHVGDVIIKLETSEDSGDSEDSDGSEDSEDKKEKQDSAEKKKKKETSEEDTEEEKEDKEEKDSSKEEAEDSGGEPEKKKDSDKKESDEDDKTGEEGQKIPASPGVRRFARELGVDLSEVKGSGKDGRISKDDVKAHSKEGSKSKAGPQVSELPDFSKWGETETKELSGIRSATAKGTAASWSSIPHVFQFDEADITGIEEFLEKNKDKAEKAGVSLTLTAVLTKIVASALRQFPNFNASIDMENEQMILKKYVNIGIAVDTEEGLLVPVVRDVDRKNIIEIAGEIEDLAKKARDRKLKPEEMKGGNFSISNLGGIGGTNFTPIIYHPQVAILGVSRAQQKPVYMDGELQARDILPLSLSYDHRLIDGADGVRFLTWISKALEDPYKALLGV
ncbi:2-oxo acid dehydrogenase subunit E2 [Christiangramia crocea]|uniref:Dihydrolipoamide acetyltransferase component of pyruvate dehydrogenase complex n=1 Tax=Christiangramia crocea TaxID=2904124 RepID=A0A9X2A8B9_9FLAO|nr:2-oxo acid dehydrogenase subunit E2 [Gramella crocea]MCG9972766.1 2-oxo acid dehydrogenase subunit E2 [Gramella crocea]